MTGFQQVYGGSNRTPGMDPVVSTFENEFKWGKFDFQIFTGLTISGAARDIGNTDYTAILRAGLLLGRVTATNKLMQWDPDAIDGSQNIWGILHKSQNMQSNGTNRDRLMGPIVCVGGLLTDALIIPGETDRGLVGKDLEFSARKQLRANFHLNDSYSRSRLAGYTPRIVSASEQAGGYTILDSDDGTNFVNTGGTVTLALPTEAKQDLEFKFTSLDAGSAAAITVSSGSSNIIVPGSAASGSNTVDGEVNTFRGDGTNWIVE